MMKKRHSFHSVSAAERNACVHYRAETVHRDNPLEYILHSVSMRNIYEGHRHFLAFFLSLPLNDFISKQTNLLNMAFSDILITKPIFC